MKGSYPPAPKADMGTDEMAVILFSGGTTGVPKGIMLSNFNFISEGMQVSVWGSLGGGDAILAILPIFHGFGLGVCVNAAFMGGGKSILVPQFTPEIVADLIKKKRPNFVVGVPTLFEALCSNPVFQKADLSCLRATFSGADTLPRPVKERFEAVVKERGGNVQLLEGYGLTEAVTAIMATPLNQYREGSVGLPFPDMLAKIVTTGTTEEAPVGEEGEICVHGPAVMLGYLDQPEETANTLKTHADGKVWLHTGDIGTMDADGFFYFKLRQKRMIKSSGMNVYPAQVEDVLYRHPDVAQGLRHRRPRREAGPARQGVRRPEGPGEGRPRDGEGAHRPLPGAPDPLELPPGDRVPERPPLHAGRQGRLQRPRRGGGREAEGRGEILRRMMQAGGAIPAKAGIQTSSRRKPGTSKALDPGFRRGECAWEQARSER